MINKSIYIIRKISAIFFLINYVLVTYYWFVFLDLYQPKNLIMKKIYYLCALLFAANGAYAQENALECGTDYLMEEYFNKNPEAKKQHDSFNLELSRLAKSGELSRNVNSRIQQGQVYEIPIVVHVLSKGDALGTENNLNDQQIIDWIDYTNKIFDGTGDRMLNETNGGAVIPVKLVLVKIDPKGKPTNGINRIDLSGNENYVQYGINSNSNFNGLHDVEVVKEYGWESTKYYNIYVAYKSAVGAEATNGYAFFPGGSQSNDRTVMSGSASLVGQQTLAHEFGHALGVFHPHQGYVAGEGKYARDGNGQYIRDENGDYVINVTKPAVCPVNNDCTIDGDGVCDTEPILSLYDTSVNIFRCLTGRINQCTGSPYVGAEQNVMSYTYCFRNRFTPGQMDRAMAQLLRYRENLYTSPVLDNQAKDNNVSLISPSCSPTANERMGNFIIGTVNVNFNEINNWTNPYNTLENNFYKDFTKGYVLAKTTTTIPNNTSTKLNIKTSDTGYLLATKVYIDYNNDGVFSEIDELVLSKNGISRDNSVTSVDVTPPSNAVFNTPLRMRVISDLSNVNITPCGNPRFGDVEDYAVTIKDETLSTDDLKRKKVEIVTNNSTLLVNANDLISNITITDITGRLIYKGDNINKNNFYKDLNTKNQIYIVVVSLKNGTKHSQKVML
ncbi:Pregnancy-associated plasma protein-A [Chishuiella changwenlii]|uniref:Pregnancy-associated plasma protein-A n=2 Tax=Chishuiella changwenlii TaxID=1434701 RepID=A0A1M6SZA5_9FLAO|nr:Pregnancy-associated plasma protein-A [Chishuiella changwenlii]